MCPALFGQSGVRGEKPLRLTQEYLSRDYIPARILSFPCHLLSFAVGLHVFWDTVQTRLCGATSAFCRFILREFSVSFKRPDLFSWISTRFLEAFLQCIEGYRGIDVRLLTQTNDGNATRQVQQILL